MSPPVDDTTLEEAIINKSGDDKGTCNAHAALIVVIKTLAFRMRRIERIGVIIAALLTGLLGKDYLIPLLSKIIAP